MFPFRWKFSCIPRSLKDWGGIRLSNVDTMPGNPSALDNPAQGYRTNRKETTISGQNIRTLLPSFLMAWAQIVDNVNEAEAICLHEHCRVRVFPTLTLPFCRLTALQNALWSDSSDNGRSWNREQTHSTIDLRLLFVNKPISSGVNSALTKDLMFFPRLSSSSINFWISSFGLIGLADMRVLAFKRVANAQRNWHTCAFSYVSPAVTSFFCVLTWYDSKS